MSSFLPVCQSFFKEKAVDYYTEGHNMVFPCFECGAMAIMNTGDTAWRCAGGHQGNLKSLIKMSEEGARPAGEIYNPKKEQARIRKTLDMLIVKYPDANLEELRKNINRLFKHFKGAE